MKPAQPDCSKLAPFSFAECVDTTFILLDEAYEVLSNRFDECK